MNASIVDRPFTREDEARLEVLQKAAMEGSLSDMELGELNQIQGRYTLFIADGLSRLRGMAPQRSSFPSKPDMDPVHPTVDMRQPRNRFLTYYGLGLVFSALLLGTCWRWQPANIPTFDQTLLLFHVYAYVLLSMFVLLAAARSVTARMYTTVFGVCTVTTVVLFTLDMATFLRFEVTAGYTSTLIDLINFFTCFVSFFWSRRQTRASRALA